MRILFTAGSVVGHALPLLPLQRGATDAGHVAALMTGGMAADAAGRVSGIELIRIGPETQELVGEAVSRSRGRDGVFGWDFAVELFGSVSVDRSFDEALAGAASFAPDLVVSEVYDFRGRLVADALMVPWVAHEVSGGWSSEVDSALRERTDEQHARRKIGATSRIALVDPYPDLLHGPAYVAPGDRLAMRPVPHGDGDASPVSVSFGRDRPIVLLTMGTTMWDVAAFHEMLRAVLACDVNVVVTAEAESLPDGWDPSRVVPVGFVPLARLLPVSDVVVGVGGTGSLLATLAAGKPTVVRPFVGDQPQNAANVSHVPGAVAVSSTPDVTTGLQTLLDDSSYADAARDTAAELALLPSPETVLGELLALATTTYR